MKTSRILFNIIDYFTPNYLNPRECIWKIKRHFLNNAGMHISKNVFIDKNLYWLEGNEAHISIDEYTIIGHNLKLYPFNKIHIGKFCMFSADVSIINGGHNTNNLEPFSGPVEIGHGCWIGYGVRIIGPLKIGDNCIIGAGSLVKDDIPDNSIVVGVPGKVIKKRKLADKMWHLADLHFCPKTFTLISKQD